MIKLKDYKILSDVRKLYGTSNSTSERIKKNVNQELTKSYGDIVLVFSSENNKIYLDTFDKENHQKLQFVDNMVFDIKKDTDVFDKRDPQEIVVDKIKNYISFNSKFSVSNIEKTTKNSYLLQIKPSKTIPILEKIIYHFLWQSKHSYKRIKILEIKTSSKIKIEFGSLSGSSLIKLYDENFQENINKDIENMTNILEEVFGKSIFIKMGVESGDFTPFYFEIELKSDKELRKSLKKLRNIYLENCKLN